jgi:hypothetical protein
MLIHLEKEKQILHPLDLQSKLLHITIKLDQLLTI